MAAAWHPSPLRSVEPAVWATTAVIFVLDLLLPPDFAFGVLYVGVILGGLWIERRGFLIQYSVAVAVLELIGFVQSSAGTLWAVGLFNHAASIGALWITAAGIGWYRRATQAREEAEARLREQTTLAELGRMAAAIAHEVRNALTSIGASLEMLDHTPPPGSREEVCCAQLQRRLAVLNDTVTDLLAYVEVREPMLGRVEVRRLVDEAVALARARLAPAAGPAVGVDVGDFTVAADREQFGRALFGLILNAAQATRDGDEIAVRASARDGHWRLEVADRGPGLSPSVQSRLFQPFYSTKTHGIGLGLAYARRVIASHGGTIDVACPPGGGTTVTLELPR